MIVASCGIYMRSGLIRYIIILYICIIIIPYLAAGYQPTRRRHQMPDAPNEPPHKLWHVPPALASIFRWLARLRDPRRLTAAFAASGACGLLLRLYRKQAAAAVLVRTVCLPDRMLRALSLTHLSGHHLYCGHDRRFLYQSYSRL